MTHKIDLNKKEIKNDTVFTVLEKDNMAKEEDSKTESYGIYENNSWKIKLTMLKNPVVGEIKFCGTRRLRSGKQDTLDPDFVEKFWGTFKNSFYRYQSELIEKSNNNYRFSLKNILNLCKTK